MKLASRWALRHGFTLEQARRFVAWVDGWVAFHRNERSAMRGIDGMDIPAYYNKLEASALERAQSAFLKLAAVDDNPRALRGLSAREAWQFLWWLERETRRYREQAFQNVERDETTEYRGVEAATLAKAHDAFVAIARGTGGCVSDKLPARRSAPDAPLLRKAIGEPSARRPFSP